MTASTDDPGVVHQQLATLYKQLLQPREEVQIVRGFGGSTLRDLRVHGHGFKMQTPHDLSKETATLQGVMAYIDPAGGGANADETAYAVTGFLNGNIFLLDAGGLPGALLHTNYDYYLPRAGVSPMCSVCGSVLGMVQLFGRVERGRQKEP